MHPDSGIRISDPRVPVSLVLGFGSSKDSLRGSSIQYFLVARPVYV